MTRATRPGNLEHYPVGRPALTAGLDDEEWRARCAAGYRFARLAACNPGASLHDTIGRYGR